MLALEFWPALVRLGDTARTGELAFDLQDPVGVEFGTNRSVTVLSCGNCFFGRNQPGAGLVRMDYLGAKGDRAPTVEVAASQDEGSSPLTVSFTSTVADPEGRRLKYAWDFDGDGDIDSRQPNPTFTYSEEGVYRATLTVMQTIDERSVGDLAQSMDHWTMVDACVVRVHHHEVRTHVRQHPLGAVPAGHTVDRALLVHEGVRDRVREELVAAHDEHPMREHVDPPALPPTP